MFGLQQGAAGPRPLSSDRLRLVLVALETNGGRLTRQELASAARIPLPRLPGLLASAAKILNIEGYMVLSDDGQIVELDDALAKSQFGL